jgi:hypothetical protein
MKMKELLLVLSVCGFCLLGGCGTDRVIFCRQQVDTALSMVYFL